MALKLWNVKITKWNEISWRRKKTPQHIMNLYIIRFKSDLKRKRQPNSAKGPSNCRHVCVLFSWQARVRPKKEHKQREHKIDHSTAPYNCFFSFDLVESWMLESSSDGQWAYIHTHIQNISEPQSKPSIMRVIPHKRKPFLFVFDLMCTRICVSVFISLFVLVSPLLFCCCWCLCLCACMSLWFFLKFLLCYLTVPFKIHPQSIHQNKCNTTKSIQMKWRKR